MTGWAQVHGWRGRTSLRKRIQYDLDYIHRWSIGLDLRILLMTVQHVFWGKTSWNDSKRWGDSESESRCTAVTRPPEHTMTKVSLEAWADLLATSLGARCRSVRSSSRPTTAASCCAAASRASIATGRATRSLPIEVVVADDGSSDDTAEWLAQSHPDVRLVRLDRNGASARGQCGG